MKTYTTEELNPASLLVGDLREEVKQLMIKKWDDYYTKSELVDDINKGYILGKYATSVHFPIKELNELADEVDLELNPIIEEVVEEPTIEETNEGI